MCKEKKRKSEKTENKKKRSMRNGTINFLLARPVGWLLLKYVKMFSHPVISHD